MQREENPFEDEVIAHQWITSIEGESELIRDKELYPFLEQWAASLNFETIVDIGSGQGIVAEKVDRGKEYIGVEPSKHLVARAKELYTKPNRTFLIGNAYQLPVRDNFADVVFSVNVWFHLEDLDTASKELSRILKPDGKFLISTANPKSYDQWEKMFEGAKKEGNLMEGKVNVPVQPMDKNRFYLHSTEDILSVLELHGLKVESISEFGSVGDSEDKKLFINITGYKSKKF